MKAYFILIVFFLTIGCGSSSVKKSIEPRKTETLAPPEQTAPETKILNPTNLEWKGVCRKIVNESGKNIKASIKNRMQSSYIFNGNEVTWFVKSFNKSECQSFAGGDRSVFSCDKNPQQSISKCKQTYWESWQKDVWVAKPMKDYSGYPIVLIMEYQFILLNDKLANLKSRSISDDGDVETESLNLRE